MGKRGRCDVEVHNASKSSALSRILAGEFEQIFSSRIPHGNPVINWCCHCRQSNVQLRAAAGWPPGSPLVTRFARRGRRPAGSGDATHRRATFALWHEPPRSGARGTWAF